MRSLLLSLAFLAQQAHAQLPPAAPCPTVNLVNGINPLTGMPNVTTVNIPGCNVVLGNPILSNIFLTAIPKVVMLLLRIVGAGAVAAIVVAGMMMIVNAGDETRVTKARTAILYALLGLVLAVTSQIIVSFVVTEEYGQTAIGDLIVGGVLQSLIRITLMMVNVTFALLLVYYGFEMFHAQGKSDVYDRARKGILWTIVGAVTINLAQQVVLLVARFFPGI